MRLLILIALITAFVARADERGCAFWVWHRSKGLASDEAARLQQGHVRSLYWHVGMVAIKDNAWVGDGPWLGPESAPSMPGVRCVPVLRGMMADVRRLPSDFSSLLVLMRRAMERWHSDEVQLDFDCPDRLLKSYANQLAACREAIRPARLSITALAGWASLPVFGELQNSVDELAPMFYDLVADQPADAARGDYVPLLARADLKRHLSAWSKCTIPWQAGLPCFARVSIFGADGRSRGHVREWTWDEVAFHSLLRLLPANGPGLSVFEVTGDTTLHSVPLHRGERIVARVIDATEAASCVDLAKQAGSKSVCWFRFPTESASSGWSLSQVLAASDAKPSLKLSFSSESLKLQNLGDGDLAPRLAGAVDEQRGWQIEIEDASQRSVFREAAPGSFAHVQGHLDPDAAKPREAPIAQAKRLTFWLADLKSGSSRSTDVFQLAPGAELPSLRWRLRGQSDKTPWQPVTLLPP